MQIKIVQKSIHSLFIKSCCDFYKLLKKKTNTNIGLYFFRKTKYLEMLTYLSFLKFDKLILLNLNLISLNSFRYNYKVFSQKKLFNNNSLYFAVFQIFLNLKTWLLPLFVSIFVIFFLSYIRCISVNKIIFA